MTSSDTSPSLVCIEYPGIVINVDKMIDTLGGADTIQQVFQEPNRRMELRFRPDDVFCKPACGERAQETSFLLKVKKKRRKKATDSPQYKYEAEIVGNIETSFKFNNLADFQYLPMVRKEAAAATAPPEYESIYDDIYFSKLVDSTWLTQPAPLFLPPAAFSRMDTPQDYQYRREAASDKAALDTPYNIIGRTRQRRSHHAIFVTYDVSDVPQGPREVAVNQLKVKFIGRDDTKEVRALFEKRPMWSKNALHAITQISTERLKFILPTLSYYFTTGPWRNQWVRFGFDPRKSRDAAQYQTLDYRVRLQGGARHRVKAKRNYSNYLLPYKAMNWSKPKTSVINRDAFSDLPGTSGEAQGVLENNASTDQTTEEQECKNDVYRFRIGRFPPYRQMFYQFCDLEVDEAQELIQSSLKSTSKCDERSGWFEEGTDAKLREILSKHISTHLASSEEMKVIEANDDDDLEEEVDDDNEDSSDEEDF